MTAESDGGSIESVLIENRVFRPPAEFSRNAHISSLDQYQEMWNRAKDDPEGLSPGPASAHDATTTATTAALKRRKIVMRAGRVPSCASRIVTQIGHDAMRRTTSVLRSPQQESRRKRSSMPARIAWA